VNCCECYVNQFDDVQSAVVLRYEDTSVCEVGGFRRKDRERERERESRVVVIVTRRWGEGGGKKLR
jgi:hypothetical protein